ncbi:CoA transferase [Alcaligenes faecalis]|uniref:CaiB/BaiF CoA transferase family protein n=1 Tax=Alcaligenes faecalis TaxID=511 RepID=UPI00203C78CB|nr:CaiB/BaiF CoA-transferase family protein [Alcaligenes faecalis]MCM2559518.1 CoA transferase [Alcaligenes faecalis]MCM2622479.1 CoA transferase [Alcaligenes faecalis]
MSQVLAGVRVLEVEAIGPVPWAGMILADLGATVVRIARPEPADMGIVRDPRFEVTTRGKQRETVDLKSAAGRARVLELAAEADALIEGMRPGVMERLGLGPQDCWQHNPALVYGRITGWGQSGPLARTVGHDINYLALSGVLHAIGPADGAPVVPLNLIGDFGAGGMLLLVGVLAALMQARSTGKGQLVDAAMVDGALLMLAPILGRWQAGQWQDQRASNLLDGGAPFYSTYQTADHKAVAVGAIEPRFYKALLDGLGLDSDNLPQQHDQSAWPAMKERFAQIFRRYPRAHWEAVFTGTEACVTPVLSLAETVTHPHFVERGSFVCLDGAVQPAAAPRFSC